MKLFEQYRPKDWSDVVGQDRAVHQIQTIAKRGLGGRAYWLSGPSGTGKSTIAELLALELCEPWNVETVDATDLSAAAIREKERGCNQRGMQWGFTADAVGKTGRAYIVNEAHGLSEPARRQLLDTPIVIVLEGGCVQDVRGLVPGTVYEVRDFDVESYDENELESNDPDGPRFKRIEYVAE